MNGVQSLIKALKQNGIRYIFGYTGGAIMPVFDELIKDKDITVVRPRHEQGAAFMAQGLSRASVLKKKKLLGVCMSTSGPGAMNMVTGIADAYMDSIPLLAISGQVNTGAVGTDAFQESDVVGVMMPITKQTYMPLKPEDIESMVHEAIKVATFGRGGPVSIDIPKDAQQGEIDIKRKRSTSNEIMNVPEKEISTKPNRQEIETIINLIQRSKRPLIIAGRGILTTGAHKILKKLVDKYQIPVTLTMHGLSAIPADHQYNLGMAGMHGTAEANKALASCDLLISLGMRFDDRITGDPKKFCSQAKIVHVDIDPSEINKNLNVDLGIVADAGKFLQELVRSPLKTLKYTKWHNRLNKFKNIMSDQEKKEIKKGTGPNRRLLLKKVIHELSEITKGRDIIVSDVGQHEMIAARYYNFQVPNSWFASGGAGTMGCSLPMAIGVKLARPKERVWCIAGDGGFQMNIQELGTLKQYNFNVKIIVSSNNTLGMVRQWQTLFFNKRYAETEMNCVHFEKIADAYGVDYIQIAKTIDIKSALRKAMSKKGPIILDFLTDQDELVLPMIPSGGNASNMITSYKIKK